MTHAPMVEETAVARLPQSPGRANAGAGKVKVVLLQTQAEAAGAQEISRNLGRELTARGCDVHSVFLFRRTAAFDDQPQVFFCARLRPTGIISMIRMLILLLRYLKELRPDAMLCFQHYGNVIGALAARLTGVPVVIANRTTPHQGIPSWLDVIDRVFGSVGVFARVVVNSRTAQEEYRFYSRSYRKRIERIDHGFEPRTTTLGRTDARRVFGIPESATVLGSVARLHPGKNIDAAIRLLPADPRWHLAVAGQGPERQHLEQLARSLGVSDRLHLIGELPPDRIGAFLRSLDVFVFPSRAETFGLAVVEAAQAGIPVVANDRTVLREVLSVDGEPCASFVDVNDIRAFAAAVRSVLDDKALSARLTSRGTALARRYSLAAMVDRYFALLLSARDPTAKAPTRWRISA